MNKIIIMLALVCIPGVAWADYYGCAKMIYADGWLKKYDYKGQTWGANTKKSGAFTSTTHVSTENTTSSVDPGVTSGHVVSTSQYTSSWGECAAVDIEISMQFRDDYIKQNLHEIKKQVALGQGYHVEGLAVLSGCKGPGGEVWGRALQSHTGELYDAVDAQAFRSHLDAIISATPDLNSMCHPPTT